MLARCWPALFAVVVVAPLTASAAALADEGEALDEPPPPLDAMPDDEEAGASRGRDPAGAGDAPSRVERKDDEDDWRRKRRERRMKRRRAVREEAAVPGPDALIGEDDLLLAAGQGATGAAVCAVSIGAPLLCAFVPFGALLAGPAAWGMMCFGMPTLSTLAQVSLGDAFGTKRGVLGWPLAAHIAYQVAITLVAGALSGVGALLLFGALTVLGGTVNSTVLNGWGLYATLGLFGGVGLLHAAATIAGNAIPAVLYLFTAEPKLPDDPDFRFPGLFEPAHGWAMRAPSDRQARSDLHTAMAY